MIWQPRWDVVKYLLSISQPIFSAIYYLFFHWSAQRRKDYRKTPWPFNIQEFPNEVLAGAGSTRPKAECFLPLPAPRSEILVYWTAMVSSYSTNQAWQGTSWGQRTTQHCSWLSGTNGQARLRNRLVPPVATCSLTGPSGLVLGHPGPHWLDQLGTTWNHLGPLMAVYHCS